MRRLFAIFFLFASIAAMAGNVSQEEALKKAQDFMKNRTDKHHGMRLAAKSTQIHKQATLAAQENYYVFNVGEQDGFIVVSGDDRTPAILGYAEEGTFDTNDIPENMKAWLQGYADQLDCLAADESRAAAAVSEHQPIVPLIRTLWDQDEPYNNLCPMDGQERSLTGCVATAMAQIFNYYKYPAKTTVTIPSYITETRGFMMDAIQPTAIEWDNMCDYYTGSETAEQKQAVANLMLLCGASVEMNYTNSYSGANIQDACQAMKKYFDFDDATRVVSRVEYRAETWDAIVYNELANKRPIFYSGQSTTGGHAFIVDGYGDNGLYHVNWGWGGKDNGYFLLSILDSYFTNGIVANSSVAGYGIDQNILIGMQPNTGVAFQTEVKMTTSGMKATTSTVTKTNGMFPITYVTTVRNYLGATYNITMGTGIYNTNNELVYSQIQEDRVFDDSWGYDDIERLCNVPSLPDGTYIITNISRKKGTDKWYQDIYSDIYHLTATISGNTLTIRNPSLDLGVSFSTSGNIEVASKLTVTATIKNNGTFFNDMLFLMVDGVMAGARYFEIEEGETKAMEMTFYPDKEGNHTVSLVLRKEEFINDMWVTNYYEIASTPITVNAASSHSLVISDGVVTNAIDGNINDRVAILSFTVKNTDTKAYNEDIQIYSLVEQSNNSGWFTVQTSLTVPISVPALQTEQMQVEIPLQRDGNYWFGVTYMTNGEYKSFSTEEDCLSLDLYEVVVPPIELGVETIETDRTVQKVYNLNGQKVDRVQKGTININGQNGYQAITFFPSTTYNL